MLYILSAAYVLVGDYYCIQASKTGCIWLLLIPSVCWGIIGPVTWYYIFQGDGFAKANVVGGVSVALISIVIGLYVFKEPLTIKHGVGLVLGLFAIGLLA